MATNQEADEHVFKVPEFTVKGFLANLRKKKQRAQNRLLRRLTSRSSMNQKARKRHASRHSRKKSRYYKTGAMTVKFICKFEGWDAIGTTKISIALSQITFESLLLRPIPISHLKLDTPNAPLIQLNGKKLYILVGSDSWDIEFPTEKKATTFFKNVRAILNQVPSPTPADPS